MNEIVGIVVSDSDENGILDVRDASTIINPDFGNIYKEALIDRALKQIIKEVIKEKTNHDVVFLTE